MSTVAEEIESGLKEAIEFARGNTAGATVHEVSVEDVDVLAARERLGMTQTAFAKAFGVSVSTLRKWERKERRPSGASRVLLKVIQHDPDAVRNALAV